MKRESWLQAAPESAAIARALVRDAAAELGLGAEATWDLMLATTEAVANAVVHGTPCSANGILLRLDACDDGLCVEVCDCGEFDVPLGPRAADDQGGRGIPIITAVVDTFELVPDAHQTRVRFGKRGAYAAA
jgi:anti-sigma regulatory factor (Ser/Thr protein kinase)